MKHIYEITAAGFDGSTDETDDRVLWIAARNEHDVLFAIANTGAVFRCKLPDNMHIHTCEIDYSLPEQSLNLQEDLLQYASDERNKNRAC